MPTAETNTARAALEASIAQLMREAQRLPPEDGIGFLNQINARVPPRKSMHIILDNYATHRHPKVLAWLARHKCLKRSS